MAVGRSDHGEINIIKPRAEISIIKPRTDNREYRRIVLSNSLEALLISDPDTDKAAASMDVSVGSYSDPEGLEGLAHFLEHMLFYASEKYHVEDSYSKYISEHGGSTNAFTASENTNFYFDINADCFEEALDRFSQFFVKPLMSADATLREIKAVDSGILSVLVNIRAMRNVALRSRTGPSEGGEEMETEQTAETPIFGGSHCLYTAHTPFVVPFPTDYVTRDEF